MDKQKDRHRSLSSSIIGRSLDHPREARKRPRPSSQPRRLHHRVTGHPGPPIRPSIFPCAVESPLLPIQSTGSSALFTQSFGRVLHEPINSVLLVIGSCRCLKIVSLCDSGWSLLYRDGPWNSSRGAHYLLLLFHKRPFPTINTSFHQRKHQHPSSITSIMQP